MIKNRITPFFITTPLIIIWATYSLIMLLDREGMALIMSGFFVGLIGVSLLLFFVDRVVVKKINFVVLTTTEILILLGGVKFIDWYLYN